MHHRVYLPLAPVTGSQAAEADSDCCIQTPESGPSRGLVVTDADYREKVAEVSASRHCHLPCSELRLTEHACSVELQRLHVSQPHAISAR